MSPKFNSDSRRKTSEEEAVDSMEGRFHEEMDEKDEFILFVRSMLKVIKYISTNIIHFGQDTRVILAKQLGAKDGEGTNIGS